ncbi:MAG: GNAT family N-acetyltransferase [Polaribacter sp.]
MIIQFKDFPTLKTERLILRKLRFNDVEAVFSVRTNLDVNRFITRNAPKNLSDAEDFIKRIHLLVDKNKGLFWVIALKETNKLVGTIGVRNFDIPKKYAEIGYELHPKYQKKGFMSEALQAVLKFGFQQMDLKIIEAFTHKNNMTSIGLLKKHHFVFQPKRRDEGFKNNRIWKLEKGKL